MYTTDAEVISEMAYLVVTVKDKELCRRELNGPVTLGRSTDCELWINDAGVSRHHCRFERNGEAWEVHDLGSRNGIALHGQRVETHALRDCDSIHAGAAKITFYETGYVSSRPARPMTPQGAGDSVSDTVISASAISRTGRALPIPRATNPGEPEPGASKPAAPLAFARPPARPIPVMSKSSEDHGRSNGEQRHGLLHRFLHK